MSGPIPGQPVGPRSPRRGDIYHVEIPRSQVVGSEQADYRPWLIVSADSVQLHMPIVVAIPLSSKLHKVEGYRRHRIIIPEAHKISEATEKGCSGESLAYTEQIRVLSVDRLPRERSARVTTRGMAAIEAGLAHVLGMP